MHPGGEHVVSVTGPCDGLAADRSAVLLECHDVGEYLAGMRAPGQAIDDRNGRMARELGQHLVVERADHDGVDIARKNPGGIGNGLPAAELHLLSR